MCVDFPACAHAKLLIISDSLRPHGLWTARLLCPQDSPGKKTAVDCHALLQKIFLTQSLNLNLLCLLHWQVGSLPLVPPWKSLYGLSFIIMKENANVQEIACKTQYNGYMLVDILAFARNKVKQYQLEEHSFQGQEWNSIPLFWEFFWGIQTSLIT